MIYDPLLAQHYTPWSLHSTQNLCR